MWDRVRRVWGGGGDVGAGVRSGGGGWESGSEGGIWE